MYRPQLESSLEEQGITWTVDVDNKSTTVSVISGDQRIIDKASQILELMAKSTVDPEVILQIIDGSQQHVNLRLWNEGGLCMKFGCEEADRSITISKTVKTKDPELFLRATILLELLGSASVPASLVCYLSFLCGN